MNDDSQIRFCAGDLVRFKSPYHDNVFVIIKIRLIDNYVVPKTYNAHYEIVKSDGTKTSISSAFLTKLK